MAKAEHAIRAVVSGDVQGVGFRDATVRRAGKEGVLGWVRNAEDGTVQVHAEGERDAVDALLVFLRMGPRGAAVEDVAVEEVKAEGHEQFAVRGVSAGAFEVLKNRGFVLRFEVDGAMLSWAVRSPNTVAMRTPLRMPYPEYGAAGMPGEGLEPPTRGL